MAKTQIGNPNQIKEIKDENNNATVYPNGTKNQEIVSSNDGTKPNDWHFLNPDLINVLNTFFATFKNKQIPSVISNSSHGSLANAYTINTNVDTTVYANCSSGDVYIELPSQSSQNFPIKVMKVDNTNNKLYIVRNGLTSLSGAFSGSGGSDVINGPDNYQVSPSRVAIIAADGGDSFTIVPDPDNAIFHAVASNNSYKSLSLLDFKPTNTTITLADGDNLTLVDATSLNFGGQFLNANNDFVAPISGKYRIHLEMRAGTNLGGQEIDRLRFKVFVNGSFKTESGWTYYGGVTDQDITLSFTFHDLFLDKNQVIDIKVSINTDDSGKILPANDARYARFDLVEKTYD